MPASKSEQYSLTSSMYANNNNDVRNNSHCQRLHHQQQQQRQPLQMKHANQHKIKTRDSSCCSINFIKYVLHIFNIIFFFSGVAITSVAIWTILCKHQYISLFATTTYELITYGFLLTGLLAVGASIWGWCGIWREQRSMICCYSFLLVTVFILECLVGGAAHIYETQIDDELLPTLHTTFVSSYGVDETRSTAIDTMQQNYRCCGAERFEEWRKSVWLNTTEQNTLVRSNENRTVPDSCCISYRIGCGKSDHPSNIPYTGCIYRFIDDTRDHMNILGAIGFGLCSIQIFGLILSSCLFCKLKYLND